MNTGAVAIGQQKSYSGVRSRTMPKHKTIPDDVWEKVQRRTNVPAASRAEFERTLYHYKRLISHNANAPSNNTVRHEIERARKALDSVRRAANSLSDDALTALAPSGCTYEYPKGILIDHVIEPLNKIHQFLSEGITRINHVNDAPTRKQRDIYVTRWYVRSVAFLLRKYECKRLTAPEGKAPDWLFELCRLADPEIRYGTVDGAVTLHLEHRDQWQRDCERWEATQRANSQHQRRGKKYPDRN